MAITRVWIEEGCTSCGLCEDIVPEVFELKDIAEVKSGADLTRHEKKIREAAESCPAEVIKFE